MCFSCYGLVLKVYFGPLPHYRFLNPALSFPTHTFTQIPASALLCVLLVLRTHSQHTSLMWFHSFRSVEQLLMNAVEWLRSCVVLLLLAKMSTHTFVHTHHLYLRYYFPLSWLVFVSYKHTLLALFCPVDSVYAHPFICWWHVETCCRHLEAEVCLSAGWLLWIHPLIFLSRLREVSCNDEANEGS